MTPEQIHELKYKRVVMLKDAHGRDHEVRVHTESHVVRNKIADKRWFVTIDGRRVSNPYGAGRSVEGYWNLVLLTRHTAESDLDALQKVLAIGHLLPREP